MGDDKVPNGEHVEIRKLASLDSGSSAYVLAVVRDGKEIVEPW